MLIESFDDKRPKLEELLKKINYKFKERISADFLYVPES